MRVIGYVYRIFKDLIHFDSAVDLSNKPVASEETDSTSEEEDCQTHNWSVPEVDNKRSSSIAKLEFWGTEVSGIDKEVNSSEPGCQIASPPPSVVFSSEVEVTEKNSSLRARDDKDNCYQEQEAKHVVDLMGPNWVQNKEQLDEDATEREDTTHDNARNWFSVEDLLWNLSLDRVSANRMLNGSLFVAIESSEEGKRNGNTKP